MKEYKDFFEVVTAVNLNVREVDRDAKMRLVEAAFDFVTIVKINVTDVEDDVLDRLDGYEDSGYEDGYRIFDVKTIRNIIKNEDDTNETTIRLLRLVEAAEDLRAEQIHLVA